MNLSIKKLFLSKFKKKLSQPIIVLGMHRSGTSCLTGLLEEAGVYLGDVSKKNPFNLKGNHEKDEIVKLNDALLGVTGGSWHSPSKELIWDDGHSEKRDQIIQQFLEVNASFWGFKDPRVMFTLDFWTQALREPLFIGSFRHPLSVAKSINKRNSKFSLEQGMNIWLEYNERLLQYHKKYGFPLVCFDVDSEEYLESVQNCFNHVGLDKENHSKLSFFDDSLRNTLPSTSSVILPSEVNQVYMELKSIYADQRLQ